MSIFAFMIVLQINKNSNMKPMEQEVEYSRYSGIKAQIEDYMDKYFYEYDWSIHQTYNWARGERYRVKGISIEYLIYLEDGIIVGIWNGGEKLY